MFVTASSVNRVSQLDQVIDRNTSPGQKWFNLQNNTLDGSYHPMPFTDPDAVSISAKSASFENCSGYRVGDPALSNSYTTPIGTGWSFGMHYSSVNDYCEVRDDGGKFGNKYIRIHNTDGTWKACTASNLLDGTGLVGKWLRASVYARTSLNSSFNIYLLFDSNNVLRPTTLVTTQAGIWTKAQITAQIPAGIGNIQAYLYGQGALGDTDYDGYVIEGPFDTDPGLSTDQVGWWSDCVSDTSNVVDAKPQLQWIMDSSATIAYDNRFDTAPPNISAMTINSVKPVLDFTSNTNDPWINMPSLGSFDPNIYRYIEFRYKVISGTAGNSQLFYLNSRYTSANEAQSKIQPLISDNLWHTVRIDMWSHADWKLYGNITGWRFDPCGSTGVNMQVAYIRLISDITQVKSIHAIQIAGDNLLNEYPVDFTIELLNVNTIIYSEDVIGNTNSLFKRYLDQVYDATEIRLTVSKINKPNTSVKILDMVNLFELNRQDTLQLSQLETSFRIDMIIRSDTLSISSIEQKSITASMARSDTLSLNTDDASFFTLYEMWSNDDLSVSADEQRLISVTVPTDDTLTVSETHTKAITATLSRPDVITIRETHSTPITAYVNDTDNLLINESHDIIMTNVHTRCNEYERRIYGKVEITYTDPLLETNLVAYATSTGRLTSPYATANNLKGTFYKAFSLHDNVLDGTYKLMDSYNPNLYGWWSANLSDSNGIFSTPEVLTVEFSARSITSLEVIGDTFIDCYPVNFDILFYNSSGTLVTFKQIRNNVLSSWSEDIINNPILNVSKMELKIYKINKPNYTARISEFYTSVVETYTKDDKLVLIDVVEESEIESSTLPIGNISSNEIVVKLDNSDKHFSTENDQSTIRTLMKANRRVKAWLGVEIIEGEIEWSPLGTFWTTDWNAPYNQIDASVIARDRIHLLDTANCTDSIVYINNTVTQLVSTLLGLYGIDVSGYYIDNYYNSIIIPYAWFTQDSYRSNLRVLAEAVLAKVFVDRNDIIHFERSAQVQGYLQEFSIYTNIYNIDRPRQLNKVVNQVTVPCSSYKLSEVKSLLDLSNLNIDINGNDTIELDLDYSTSPAYSVSDISITGNNLAVISYTSYAMHIKLSIKNNASVLSTLTSITVNGVALDKQSGLSAVSKDIESISDRGLLPYAVPDNYYIQNISLAKDIADTVLSTFTNEFRSFNIDSTGDISLAISNNVLVPDTHENTIQTSIVRQHISYDGSLNIELSTVII